MTEHGQAEKRPRLDEQSNFRSLNINLDDFPSWVRGASNEELIKAFKIGVLVKDSVEMNVTFQDTNIVDLVSKKLNETLKPMYVKLEEIAPSPMQNDPYSKGIEGEHQVFEALQSLKSNGYDVEDVSKADRRGDFLVTNTSNMNKYLIEVKNCKNTVGTQDVEKFERDVQQNANLKAGIILSLKSGIAMRTNHRQFEIAYLNKQLYIYLPNVSSNEHLIPWSVFLADALAALDEDLSKPKIDLVEKLFEDFKKHMDGTRKCRRTIASLKETVEELERDMEPLLKIIEEAKTKLNRVIH